MTLLVGLTGTRHAGGTTFTFEGAAANANEDIPFSYGSFIAGDSTGFVTTDGTGPTPHIGLSWVGNLPNEWEYHSATTWVHESPVNVAQMDHNRGSEFDDVAEIVFSPIDGRAVRINSFLLSGATDQGATAVFDWEVVGTTVGGTLNVGVGANTGIVPVNFTGLAGAEYTLRFTHDDAPADSNIGTALDDLSISEVIVPGAEILSLTVDRATGGMTLANVGDSSANIKGYVIRSASGALNTAGWKSISGNYDVNGDGSVDIDDNWTRLSLPGVTSNLSEFEFGGDGGTLAPSASVDLSLPAGAWLQSPWEDLTMEVTMTDGRTNHYSVTYANGPAGGFTLGDLNFDGSVTPLDWPIYNSGRGADLTALSLTQAYRLGDLDGDLDNDIADFVLFKDYFELANGPGSFARMIPEPATGLLGWAVARRHLGLAKELASDAVWWLAGRGVAALVGLHSFGGHSQATTLTFAGDPNPATNSDLPQFYGSNIAADAPGFVTTDGTGATPNIALTWAPTGGIPNTNALDADVLEFHSSSTFSGAGFTVPVLQFDVDLSGHPSPPDDPTVDFTVSGGYSFKLNSFLIGNATDQTEPPYRWNINLIRLSDMTTVATRTTGLLSAGSLESVTFDYTGDANESYRLQFDDEGANRVRTAIDDFSFSQVMIDEPQLKLMVSRATGGVALVNDSGNDFSIDSYEIHSASRALDPDRWFSLQDQDFEGNGDPGTGNGWEEAGGIGDHQLIESYLTGSSTMADGMTPVSFGRAFDVRKPGAMEDLEFSYHLAGTGGILRPGEVEFVSGALLAGDYSGNGIVDAADFVVWRNTLGQSGPNLAADGDGNGIVQQADFTFWRDRFGNTYGNTALAVPEPNTLTLFGILFAGMACQACRSRPPRQKARWGVGRGRRIVQSAATCLLAITLTTIAVLPAVAAVTTDRLYKFGEHPNEPATAGAIVGGTGLGTLDSMSQGGSPSASDAQNLTPGGGGPRYVNVGPTGLNRPGASMGQFGAQFDGVDDHLVGIPLNRPDETAGPSSVGTGPLIFPFPYNYDEITARGVQLWVYPDASALGNSRQGIVHDTIAAGGISITADGMWTQTNDSKTLDSQIEATVPVVGNQWHHVMQHIYRTGDGGPEVLPGGARGDVGFTSVVYVNGVAVSANNGSPTPGELDNGDRIGVLALGAEEIATVDFVNPGLTNFFKGSIDDLEMYVYGDNSSVSSSPPGQDYGTFQLFTDNDWIADQIATLPGGMLQLGDVNRDGNVNEADIAPMAAGWLSENRFRGAFNEITVGDWNTWGQGDLDLNGIVDLDDAIILDRELVALGGPGIDFSIFVPEPSAFLLSCLGILMCTRLRKSRRC